MRARAFMRWWLEGLRGLLPAPLRRRPDADERLCILAEDDGRLRIDDAGNGGIAAALRLAPDGTLPAAGTLPNPILETVGREREIVLLLPAARMLGRRLRLPITAAPELRQVLGFEIDRSTPFRQEEVYFDYRESDRDRRAGQLKVEFLLVPKSIADPLLDRLRAQGLAPHGMDVAGRDGCPGGWNLLPDRLRPAPPGGGNGPTWTLAALAGALLLANLYLPSMQKAAQARALERELAGHAGTTARLRALRAEHDALLAQHGFAAERRRRQPPVITLLAELTRLLPDDSWLERLSLQDGEVQLQGQSSRPAALIPLIESSAHFGNTRFRAPITRNDRTFRDHFHISTRLAGRLDPEPI